MIYVAGHRGFLGSYLVGQLKLNVYDVLFPARLIEHRDVIINCIAKTNHNACELEPEKAWGSNVEVTKHLCKIAKIARAKVLHISSDYVFDGNKPTEYVEDDPLSPLNSVYAQTKAAGEIAVQTLGRDVCTILRTSWLFGPGRPAWFDQPKIWGQVGTPTYMPDLAKVCFMIARHLEDPDVKIPPILHYATSDVMFRSQVALMAGNKHFERTPVPENKPRQSSLKTSQWILDRHQRPTLEDCINDYRRATQNVVPIFPRQEGSV